MSLDHYVTLGRSGLRVSPFVSRRDDFLERISVGAAAWRNPTRSSMITWSEAVTSSTPRTFILMATRRRSLAII